MSATKRAKAVAPKVNKGHEEDFRPRQGLREAGEARDVLLRLTAEVVQIRAAVEELTRVVTQVGVALASGASVRAPEKDHEPLPRAEPPRKPREEPPKKEEPATLEDARRAVLSWMAREKKTTAQAQARLREVLGVDACSKLTTAEQYARCVAAFSGHQE